ncbi:U3 small nucleolar ribonucleoprotein IMP4-like [Salvia divinorum]|uniref:U3 small nucleolar ribonucleoprotein IMP4-like n=1 Tax=Salvia divinorum TaxID=28513 RepID=A0ABD1HWT9_SALDI
MLRRNVRLRREYVSLPEELRRERAFALREEAQNSGIFFELKFVFPNARHDIKGKKALGTMPETYPHLIVNNYSSKLNLFVHLVPVFLFRSSSNLSSRFKMFLFKIKLGTMDREEAPIEWVHRPYMNTSKKRKFLGE